MKEIRYPEPNNNYKVLVQTNTYNQSQYIIDTLNGVAIQQTTFPFVHFVIDDASTDGEQDVIQRWLNENCDMQKAEYIDIPSAYVIIVKHKTNENCTLAVYFLKQNLFKKPEKNEHTVPWREHCEYIAFCEGDDYWINPLKLQTQSDYMDSHPECGLCYGKAKSFEQSKGVMTGELGTFCSGYEQLMTKGNAIPTLTAFLRLSLYNNYNSDIRPQKHWKMGDLPLWIYISHSSKIHFIDEFFAVYRVLQYSVTGRHSYETMCDFYKSSFEIRLYINELFKSDLDKQIKMLHNKNMYEASMMFQKWDEAKFWFRQGFNYHWKDIVKYLILSFNLNFLLSRRIHLFF